MHSRVEQIAISELAMKVLPSERVRMVAVTPVPVPPAAMPEARP